MIYLEEHRDVGDGVERARSLAADHDEYSEAAMVRRRARTDRPPNLDFGLQEDVQTARSLHSVGEELRSNSNQAQISDSLLPVRTTIVVLKYRCDSAQAKNNILSFANRLKRKYLQKCEELGRMADALASALDRRAQVLRLSEAMHRQISQVERRSAANGALAILRTQRRAHASNSATSRRPKRQDARSLFLFCFCTLMTDEPLVIRPHSRAHAHARASAQASERVSANLVEARAYGRRICVRARASSSHLHNCDRLHAVASLVLAKLGIFWPPTRRLFLADGELLNNNRRAHFLSGFVYGRLQRRAPQRQSALDRLFAPTDGGDGNEQLEMLGTRSARKRGRRAAAILFSIAKN